VNSQIISRSGHKKLNANNQELGQEFMAEKVKIFTAAYSQAQNQTKACISNLNRKSNIVLE
jgi:hypothetical protein